MGPFIRSCWRFLGIPFPLKKSIQPLPAPLVCRRWLDPMEKLLRCSPACRSKGPPKALASLMAKGGEVAQLLHGMPAVRETQDGLICGCSEKNGGKTDLSWTKTMIEQGDDVVVQCEMSWVIVDDPGILSLDMMAGCYVAFLKMHPGAKSFFFF